MILFFTYFKALFLNWNGLKMRIIITINKTLPIK